MSVTPNMNIILPTPEVTTGPEWANQIVDAFDNVDAHDHTSNKGVKVPTAGLNINADLEFNNYNAIELRSSRYTNHGSTLSGLLDKNCIYFVNGNFFINNNAGVSVQLTSGNAINLSTVGTIGGDYGQPGVTASATYSNSTKTFSWTQAPTQTAKMAVGDLIIYETVASANPITIKSSSGVLTSYDYWLPQSGPTANQMWRQNSTSTGADFVTLQGTASQITITHSANAITASLPSALVTPGTLRSTGNFDVATNKFTVAASSGNTVVGGTLTVTGTTALTGDLSVNSGNIVTSLSTLNVGNTSTNLNLGTSATSVTIGANGSGTAFMRNLATNFSGSIDVNNKFNVASTTGTITSQGNLSLTGTIQNTEGFTGNGRGIVPLGAIIAMTTGLSGSMSVPVSGAVSNGWIRCDGSAIPGGQSVSGTTPNLTNSIYLRGASVYGGTGGNNSTTLSEANLPAHTHSAGTYATSIGITGGTASLTGTTTFAAANHVHSMAHNHISFYYDQNTYAWYGERTSDYNRTSYSTSNQKALGTTSQGTLGSSLVGFSTYYFSGQHYTTGVSDGVNGTGGNAYTAGPNATASVGLSSTAASLTGSNTVTGVSGSVGSAASFSNEPNFINVIYLMRVN